MIYISSLCAFIFQSFSVFIYEGTDVWLLVEIINILMSFVSFYGNGEFKARGLYGVRTAGVRAILEIFRCLGDFSVNRMT